MLNRHPSLLVLIGFSPWLIMAGWSMVCRWAGADGAFVPGLALMGAAVALYFTFLNLTK